MLTQFREDTRGAAAVEFALCSMMLVVGLMNAVDVGYYGYTRMQVESAAQVGAQMAWKTCSSNSMLPATQNCSGLTTAITAAVQSTSLGTAVTLASGYPTEGYYCANSSNQLVSVGSLSSRPANCSSQSQSGTTPGDYIQVQVTYQYKSMFPGITIINSVAPTTISKTTWMRLG